MTLSANSSWEKRLDVVGRYMLLGNLRVVSEQTDVPYATLVEWKKSEWWSDFVDQIKRQKKSKTNEHITKIIEQSLEVMQDRLQNGDFVMNNKTGEIIRKPVGVRDVTAITTNLLQRQLQIEDTMERNNHTNDSVSETLLLLAREFQKWTKPPLEIVEQVPPLELEGNNNAIHDERGE